MTRVLFLVFVLAGTLAGFASPQARAQTPEYAVSLLQTQSGSFIPEDVNGSGQVVGYGDTGSTIHAYLWNGSVAVDLGTLGGPDSRAHAINDTGEIVGESALSGGGYHAFRYAAGTMSDLGTLPGMNSSFATGINSSGTTVGTSALVGSGTPTPHAFRYSGGTMSDLGLLPQGTQSWGYGVNDSGIVVGLADRCDTGACLTHAFAYQNGMVDLNGSVPFPMQYMVTAKSINSSGQIAGTTSTFGGGPTHAFLYSNGTMTDLGILGGGDTSGGNFSYPNDINSAGLIVGASDSPLGRHAFLYRNGTMIDLNDLITAGSGWILDEAFAINDAGLIVGKGRFGTMQQGFLLTPNTSGTTVTTTTTIAPTTTIPCDRPTIDVPSDQHLEGADWSLDASVTPAHGLEVRNVRKGSRKIFDSIAAPLAEIDKVRVRLRPDGDDTTGRSRLIGFNSQASAGDLFLQARYVVDRLPKDPAACVDIHQTYHFQTNEDYCEPTGKIACTRFFPDIRYQTVYPIGATSRRHTVAFLQRLGIDFGSPSDAAALFKDKSFFDKGNFVCNPVVKGDNPLRHEIRKTAISSGDYGSVDNLHVTFRDEISEPVADCIGIIPTPGDVCTHAHPGCPECVHIHWRWFDIPDLCEFPSDHDGHADVPSGSRQDVRVAVTAYDAAEYDDVGQVYPDMTMSRILRRLATKSTSVEGQKITFWYAASSTGAQDEFFQHGGFVAPPEDVGDKFGVQGGFEGPVAGGYEVDMTITGPAPLTEIAAVFDELTDGVDLLDAYVPLYSKHLEIGHTTGGVAKRSPFVALPATSAVFNTYIDGSGSHCCSVPLHLVFNQGPPSYELKFMAPPAAFP